MIMLKKTHLWAETISSYLVADDQTPSDDAPWDKTKISLHFVIILTDRIGDAFNSLYFVNNLRRLYPRARLTYIGRVFGDARFGRHIIGQYVNEVLFLETLSEEKFKELRPDVIFDLNPVSGLFPYYPSEMAIRVGHHDRCDIVIPQPHHNWKANDHLNILRFFGKDVKYTYPPIRMPQRGDKRFLLSWPKKDYVAVCFEATARAWMMSERVMDDVINYLLERNSWDVCILGNNINEHGYLYSERSERVHQYTGQLSLLQTICVLAHAKFVVSVDTGLMHATSYLGTPILGVFTCGDPGKNGPQGPNGISLVTRVCMEPPSGVIAKRDHLQSGKERNFLRIDHVVEGIEKLFVAKKTNVAERIITSEPDKRGTMNA